MPPRILRGSIVLLFSFSGLLDGSASSADAPGVAPTSLTISVPGPINGCGALSGGLSPLDASVLDLTQPSAFLNNAQNVLHGAGGAIATAELVSLNPQTVVYGIAPQFRWSDDHLFTSTNLIRWWESARRVKSSNQVGYRDIIRLIPSADGREVVATFRKPDTGWPLLFRDVGEYPSLGTRCGSFALVHRPSLGPYHVVAATRNQVTLRASKAWTLNGHRFSTIVITTSLTINSNPQSFVGYRPDVTASDVTAMTLHPTFDGSFSSSNGIAELQFSPRTPIVLRRALSLLIVRSRVISARYGSVTRLPYPSSSALFAQGMPGGPGPFVRPVGYVLGSSPVPDCTTCAERTLLVHHYVVLSGARTYGGRIVALTLGVGPTALDRATARQIVAFWRRAHFVVRERSYSSDAAASLAARRSLVAVSMLVRPTASLPQQVADSFLHSTMIDSYATGFTSSDIQRAATRASSLFNETSANASWNVVDEAILRSFIVRPLFTLPALTEWSSTVRNITASNSLIGLLDSLPNWVSTLK